MLLRGREIDHPLPETSWRFRDHDSACLHRAAWVVADADTVIQNGYVLVEKGRIVDLGSGRPTQDAEICDYGSGFLMPTLVNAHTHLELSALKGRVPFDGGFRSWVQALLACRNAMDTAELMKGATDSANDMLSAGTRTVGDISTLGWSQEIFLNTDLLGVWFQEGLGHQMPSTSIEVRTTGKVISYAGHALHSTHPDVLMRMKRESRKKGLPFSVHLAESEDEKAFLSSREGAWADFLRERGVDFTDWPLPQRSPVAYAQRLGLLDDLTLAVHINMIGEEDLDILARHHVNVCLCPRSNQNLHGQLPDIPKMLAHGLKPCLGTDSLASVASLSMFDEMAFVHRHFPGLSPATILEMGMVNGAAALGLGDLLGRLRPGYPASFMYLPGSAAGKEQVMESIIQGELAPMPPMCPNALNASVS